MQVHTHFYELMEYAIARFGLASQSDAYLTYFLEEIWQFNKPSQGGIYGFLSHWELNEDKWSIAAPEGVNAVTIMTVHKSKGLEFPVVIFHTLMPHCPSKSIQKYGMM